MALVDWDDSLLVGVDAIDSQHKKLVELINSMHSAAADSASENIEPYFIELYRYVSFHFSEEEALMKSAAYSDMAAHVAEHHVFVKKLDHLASKVRDGAVCPWNETLGMLVRWLSHHIAVTDKKLMKCLAENENVQLNS